MKRWAAYLLITLFLVSCSSFPSPQGNESCLVVGNMTLDFPDGFFTESARTFNYGIVLNLDDLDGGSSFSVRTGDSGYYYFTAKPGHRYELHSWQVTLMEGRTYKIGPYEIGWIFTAVPGKVLYIQNILMTFRAPKKGTGNTWIFSPSASVAQMPEGVRTFIEASQPNSAWLDYELETAALSDARKK